MADIDFKGPWDAHANLTASENHKGWRFFREDGTYLGEVYPLDPDGEWGKPNCELVAAAPDMLEALREIRKVCAKAGVVGFFREIDDIAQEITKRFEE